MKNIEIIIKKYPDYARNFIGVQSVLAKNINIDKAQEFIRIHFNTNSFSKKVATHYVFPEREKGVFLSQTEVVKENIEDIISSFRKKLDYISKKQIRN